MTTPLEDIAMKLREISIVLKDWSIDGTTMPEQLAFEDASRHCAKACRCIYDRILPTWVEK